MTENRDHLIFKWARNLNPATKIVNHFIATITLIVFIVMYLIAHIVCDKDINRNLFIYVFIGDALLFLPAILWFLVVFPQISIGFVSIRERRPVFFRAAFLITIILAFLFGVYVKNYSNSHEQYCRSKSKIQTSRLSDPENK